MTKKKTTPPVTSLTSAPYPATLSKKSKITENTGRKVAVPRSRPVKTMSDETRKSTAVNTIPAPTSLAKRKSSKSVGVATPVVVKAETAPTKPAKAAASKKTQPAPTPVIEFPTHPGEMVLKILGPNKPTTAELAKILGVKIGRVNDLLSKRVGLSVEMAVRLASMFKVSITVNCASTKPDAQSPSNGYTSDGADWNLTNFEQVNQHFQVDADIPENVATAMARLGMKLPSTKSTIKSARKTSTSSKKAGPVVSPVKTVAK